MPLPNILASATAIAAHIKVFQLTPEPAGTESAVLGFTDVFGMFSYQYAAGGTDLFLFPNFPLLPGTRYLYVVTSRVRNAAGAPLRGTLYFDALKSTIPLTGSFAPGAALGGLSGKTWANTIATTATFDRGGTNSNPDAYWAAVLGAGAMAPASVGIVVLGTLESANLSMDPVVVAANAGTLDLSAIAGAYHPGAGATQPFRTAGNLTGYYHTTRSVPFVYIAPTAAAPATLTTPLATGLPSRLSNRVAIQESAGDQVISNPYTRYLGNALGGREVLGNAGSTVAPGFKQLAYTAGGTPPHAAGVPAQFMFTLSGGSPAPKVAAAAVAPTDTTPTEGYFQFDQTGIGHSSLLDPSNLVNLSLIQRQVRYFLAAQIVVDTTQSTALPIAPVPMREVQVPDKFLILGH